MKKIIIAVGAIAAIAASDFASASALCSGTASKATVQPAGTPVFVKTTFTTPCSNNVTAVYSEPSATGAAVAAGSSKGACLQIGHTDAGVRAKTATCSAAAPDLTSAGIATEAAAALTNAEALGSS